MLQRSAAINVKGRATTRPRLALLKYAQLFLPYVLAELLAPMPPLSYLTAWVGSLLILYVTITGKIKPLPADRPLVHQILRPIVFTQMIFVSYMALTSIFYFAEQLGYYYLQFNPIQAALQRQVALLAEAQRLYVLGHAALATGMLLAMDYRSSGKWKLNINVSLPRLMLLIAVGALGGSFLLGFVPGLSQLTGRLATLSLVASILSLALALPSHRLRLIMLNLVIYGLNFVRALMSGWKEEVIVMLFLLGLFAYPYYRRTVTVLAPLGLLLILAFLPTYNSTFRSLNWRGEVRSTTQAASLAYETVQQAGVETLKQNTWEFLTGRASEISMFTIYLRRTPEWHNYYGTRLVEQALQNLIPRLVWSSKPNTEQRIMQRVYDYGVVSSASNVSAKPHFIVDAFLSAGAFGVFLFSLIYGLLASLASRLAERWFGGYLVGTGLVYTALFQVMWTGNSFEFFLNTVFWSFAIMLGLYMLGRNFGLLVPASSQVRKS